MAATFFGEVVKAPCRAGTEDEDEEEDRRRETPEDREVRRQLARKREVQLLRRQTKTSLEVSLLQKYPCSKFIIAIGNNAVAFLSSFVMNSGVWEEVGCAKLWNEWCRTTDTLHLSPTDAFCVFYHLKSNPSNDLCECSPSGLIHPVSLENSSRPKHGGLPDASQHLVWVLLCQCSCYVAEDQQYQWLEKVFGSCTRKNMQITIITCRHVTDYKTPESTCSLPSPFLKALKTENFKDTVCCSLLEQPNIVHDLPAAVLSYCQVWKIPAILYLCYTDVMKLDPITVEAFKPILSSQSLKCLVKIVMYLACRREPSVTTKLTKLYNNFTHFKGTFQITSQNIPQSTELLKKLTTTNETQSNIYT